MGLTTALSGFGPSALHLANQFNNTRMIGATKPAKYNQAEAEGPLLNALEGYLQDNARTPIEDLALTAKTPQSGMEGFHDVLRNPNTYSSSGRIPGKDNSYGVSFNPNADRSYFAHELGHVAAQQFDFGNLVHQLDNQPAVKKALLGALLLAPGTASALEAGDDDMDTALAIGLAAASPTILKESLATKHGLAIMDTAGMRANLGQRGRLAGGLMSYVGAPIAIAAGGNVVGNLFDEDTGELPM